ncbi:hypothetical protein LTR53_002715 [Teratosphaeriaceae sp. CCFEE 6253]|nr:hypothetical protein LTR53_002715 [Teratosphaeriaceae sp. CCFEE 6253]
MARFCGMPAAISAPRRAIKRVKQAIKTGYRRLCDASDASRERSNARTLGKSGYYDGEKSDEEWDAVLRSKVEACLRLRRAELESSCWWSACGAEAETGRSMGMELARDLAGYC